MEEKYQKLYAWANEEQVPNGETRISVLHSLSLNFFFPTLKGQSIKENASAGVIIVEQSLVIRRVSRNHSGRYSCTAVNTEGSSTSNIVLLRVMCKFDFWSQQ